jgi:hypothetical protein
LPADWTSAPALNIPDWPPADDHTYATSPLSSPAIYSPTNSNTWNYFDENYEKAIEATPPEKATFTNPMSDYPANVMQSSFNQSWTPDNDAQAPFVSLSLVTDSSAPGIGGEEDPDVVYPYCASPTSTANSPHTRRAGWGNHSRRSSTSSKPEKTITRSKDKEVSKNKKSGSTHSKGHKLRSTKMGQKVLYAEKKDEKEDASKGARNSHNMVEKQYRTRLNGQFSTLLGVLPPEVIGAETGDSGRTDGADKRVSKAEVLILAKKHIEDLERAKRELEDSKKALLSDVQRLKGAWVSMGGDVLP